MASRGKFVRVFVEVDLTKPLKAGYNLRGVLQEVQYEGLHELCFHCGKYVHRSLLCPTHQSVQKPKCMRVTERKEKQLANVQGADENHMRLRQGGE